EVSLVVCTGTPASVTREASSATSALGVASTICDRRGTRSGSTNPGPLSDGASSVITASPAATIASSPTGSVLARRSTSSSPRASTNSASASSNSATISSTPTRFAPLTPETLSTKAQVPMSDTDTRTDDGELDGASSRRQLLSKGAVAAAAAAVVGLASSQRANAANGDTMFVGANNVATTNTTRLSGGSTFWVQNGQTDGTA